MSALTNPIGGMLSQLVAAQRGMTTDEAERFLATGEVPDLSRPPVEEEIVEEPALTESEALQFLADKSLVAAGGFSGPVTHHYASPIDETFIFNPLQKRDQHGRWTDDISAKKVLPSVKSTRDFTSKYHSDYDNSASLYQSGSGRFNHPLRESRGEALPDDNARAAAHRLDEMLAGSPAKRDITVRRVIADPRRVFGAAWKSDGNNEGLEWVDFGYTSTSANPRFIEDFAENHVPVGDAVVMNIRVPKGMGALHMRGSSSFADEDEILLPRGTRFRVAADHGVAPDGTRRLTVEAASGNAPRLPESHPYVDPPESQSESLSNLHQKLLAELTKGAR